MTVKDCKAVLALLQTEYPASFSHLDSSQMQLKVELWARMFAGDDPKLVRAAVEALLAHGREFAPNAGQIREKMYQLTSAGSTLADSEAWMLVSKACTNGIYGAEKEFEKLPKEVQMAVGSPEQIREWALQPPETFSTVTASNFMRSYRTVVQRQKEFEMVPESVKALLGTASANMALPGA